MKCATNKFVSCIERHFDRTGVGTEDESLMLSERSGGRL